MLSIASHQPSWRPPFCPNPNCRYHITISPRWCYKKIGFYRRQIPPHRIQRFLCLHCRRSFSCQTFSPTYWLKRPEILAQLPAKTCGAMANRQAARDLGCAPATVDSQLARLGRHCLLFHCHQRLRARPPTTVVVDGFETFELSQSFPFHHHLAVDAATGFFLGFTDSPLRRKGRMTAWQKRRRQELEERFGRPDPQAVSRDMRLLLEDVLPARQEVTVRSDDHRAYQRALRRLRRCVRHEVTSSRARRDRQNPLWEINLLDLLLRHSLANHRRETWAWAKRRQRSSERLAVYLVWRNYVQPRWLKRGGATPAMLQGVCQRPWTVNGILARRLFVTRSSLPPRWRSYYWGDVETPALGVNRRHALTFAA